MDFTYDICRSAPAFQFSPFQSVSLPKVSSARFFVHAPPVRYFSFPPSPSASSDSLLIKIAVSELCLLNLTWDSTAPEFHAVSRREFGIPKSPSSQPHYRLVNLS